MINIKAKIDISKICAAYIVIWSFLPPLQVGKIYRIAAVACLGIWFMLSGIKMLNSGNYEQSFLILIAVTIVLRIISMSFYFGPGQAATKSLQFIIILSVGVISMFYIRRDRDYLRKLVFVCLILLCIYSVTTIIGVIINPYAARVANSEWLEGRYAGNENIGLYGFVYMCVLIIPLLFDKILSHIKVSKLFDIVSVVAFVLMFFMAMRSGYMIAIFCSVLGCAAVYYLHNRGNVKASFFLIIAVLFLIFFREIAGAVLSFLMRATEGNIVYYNKFRDLKLLLLSGDVSGETVFGRWKNYKASVQEIIRYPVLGSYIFGKTLGGGHSFILDTLGKMGVVTAAFQFLSIFAFPFKIYVPANRGKTQIAFLISLIVFSLADPIPQEIGVAIYLFFPFFRYLSDSSYANQSLQGEEE